MCYLLRIQTIPCEYYLQYEEYLYFPAEINLPVMAANPSTLVSLYNTLTQSINLTFCQKEPLNWYVFQA